MARSPSLAIPVNAVAHLGGHASRWELIALGCDPDYIDLSLWYREILPARRGWHASRETPEGLGRDDAVVHWTRRDLPGSRLVVTEEVARWQAASCRAKRPG